MLGLRGLHRQERHALGDPRPLRRHRLGAVVAALAVDALGADRVYGVGLPSKWSSEHSLTDAEDSREAAGPALLRRPDRARWSRRSTASVELTGVAAENLQARVRGTLLMGLSNQHGHLLLATSNKSEVAVGYSTLYGDAAGGYAPIKDVPKTLVWELARWRNAEAPPTAARPSRSRRTRIDKPPSAELAPGQQDSDSLPSYEELDAVIADYVDRDLGMARAARARARRRGGRRGSSGWWTSPSSSAASRRPGRRSA